MAYSSKTQKIALAVVAAAGLAIPAEGLYQKAYKDPVGILTVCYGHTAEVDARKTYTKDECMNLLSKDMLQAVLEVDKCQPDLPFGVLVAFSDTVFNVGPKVACDTSKSTAARYLKAKDYVAACKELPRWNKALVGNSMVALPGLTKRRLRAQEVCLKGASSV